MPGNKLNAHPSLGYIWGCFFCLFCFVLNAEPQTAKSQCREVMKFAQGPQLLSNSAEIWTKPVSPLMAQTPPSKQRGWVPCSSSSILPGHQTESWRLQVSLAFFFQHPECQNPGRKHGWTISQPGVYKRRREKKKEKQGSVRMCNWCNRSHDLRLCDQGTEEPTFVQHGGGGNIHCVVMSSEIVQHTALQMGKQVEIMPEYIKEYFSNMGLF